MSNIEKSILDSIDILLNKRISQLDFDKTVRATIEQVADASIGKYLVRYQNSKFYAYSDPDVTYEDGDQVYVQIPSSDYNKTKLIVGSVKELGTKYVDVITAEDKMTVIGTNVLSSSQTVSFCSYGGEQQRSIKDNVVAIDTTAFSTYKESKKYFLLGMNVRTNLPVEQQNKGNYGIIVQAKYYNTAYKNKNVQTDADLITRTYVLDVNNMQGQPYKYTLKNRQYVIFSIDGDNLKEISDIQAFCTGFPHTEAGKPDDIFLSDFELEFMEPLTDTELSGASLKILTPEGIYLESDNDNTKYLQAQMKIKGKKVNLETQTIFFYWFIRDTTVTSSDTEHYSQYAGEGWRCLNNGQLSADKKVMTFVPDTTGKYLVMPAIAKARVNTFKCVAIYNQSTSLSATIQIENRDNGSSVMNITSSAGTSFYFDSGKTTLTCNIQTSAQNLTYFWGYRNMDGSFTSLNDHSRSIDISISEATDIVTYECTVYSGQTYMGTATITLTNGTPSNEYTLVINNGTQVFKYDAYGVSPASSSQPKPISVAALSFDIYNDQGQIVTPDDDDEKVKMCAIKWIWPDNTRTLLDSTGVGLIEDVVINPIDNSKISRYIIQDKATVAFGIKNKYDITLTDNNIRLEVAFQGKNLVASTSFTFVKDGDLGTNGTEYVSRIVPRNSLFTRVYVENNKFYGWYNQSSKVYDAATGRSSYVDNFVFQRIYNAYPLKTQLWDGNNTSVYDSQTNTSEIDAKETWEIVDIGQRTNHNLTVGARGLMSITGQNNVSTVIKTTIATNELAENVKNYYATYSMDVAVTPNDSYHVVVDGGYRECRYESDGTRSNFDTKPFVFRIFYGSQEQQVDPSRLTWTVSWYNSAQNRQINSKNNVTIQPPSMYNSEGTNNYIVVTYPGYRVVISVHLYLNRTGLASINDWDGTSIKLNQEGSQYLMAPQIGAGERESDGSFTGMTMGKSFGVNGQGREVGLMGFNKGIRTIFLDAEDGKGVFGAPGADGCQIVIAPESYGRAPKGSIYSGSYWYWSNGRPVSEAGRGMMIDFSTPQIKFGSGNFSVTPEGYLTAKGGGSIGGWKINDTQLYSNVAKIDGRITLCAGTKNGVGEVVGPGYIYSHNHSTLRTSVEGFYLGKDGLSIGSQVRIDAKTGVMRLGNSALGGSSDLNWTINSNSYRSWIATNNKINAGGLEGAVDTGVYLGTDGISLGNMFKLNNRGEMNIGLGAVDDSRNQHWTIRGTTYEGGRSYISYNKTSRNAMVDNSVYIGTDGISLGTMFWLNNKGQMRIGDGAVDNSGAHWTIVGATGERRSYIGYVKTRLGDAAPGVYLGTDGLSIGTLTSDKDEDESHNGAYIDINGNTNFSGRINAKQGKIGDLYIDNGAIHSKDKNSASDTTNGVYIDKDYVVVGTLGSSGEGTVSGKGFRAYSDGSVRVQGGAIAASQIQTSKGYVVMNQEGQINTTWMHIVTESGTNLGGFAPYDDGKGVISGMTVHATEGKWYFTQGIDVGSLNVGLEKPVIELASTGGSPAKFHTDVIIDGDKLTVKQLQAQDSVGTKGLKVTGGAEFDDTVTFKKPISQSYIEGLSTALTNMQNSINTAVSTANSALTTAQSALSAAQSAGGRN